MTEEELLKQKNDFKLAEMQVTSSERIKISEFKYNLGKVIFGTMIIGLAAAFFPYAQKLAELDYTEKIETIRFDAQTVYNEKKYNLEKKHQDSLQKDKNRKFLQDLADEGRNEDVDTRIRLAAFFAHMADGEERKHWEGFLEYLEALQLQQNKEQKDLESKKNAPNTSPSQKLAIQKQIEQIEKARDPSVNVILKSLNNPCEIYVPIDLKMTISNDKIDQIDFCYSPNHGGNLKKIEYIIIDYTAGGNSQASVNWYRKTEAQASTHLIIGRNGSLVQLGEFNKVMWHFGRSNYANRVNMNDYSIGISLVNWGKLSRSSNGDYTNYLGKVIPNNEVYTDDDSDKTYWHKFSTAQLDALNDVLKVITQKYSIPIENILGRVDISPERRIEPGLAFDLDLMRKRVTE